MLKLLKNCDVYAPKHVGMRDILPEEMAVRNYVEQTIREGRAELTIQHTWDSLNYQKVLMEAVNAVRLRAPTAIGQVALADVCGLGSNVIVTKNVARR